MRERGKFGRKLKVLNTRQRGQINADKEHFVTTWADEMTTLSFSV